MKLVFVKLVSVLTGLFYIITFAQADKTWETVWKSSPSYKQVFFVDRMNGWIVSDDGFIKHTEDGGETWSNQQFSADMSLWGLYFINPDIGWIIVHIGRGSAIFHTEDGGEVWKKQELPFELNKYLHSLYFCDKNCGWIVGENGLILHTSDGGNTWVKQDSGVLANLRSVQAVDKERAYTVFALDRPNENANKILYTVNGGKRWRILSDISAFRGNIQFLNKQHGYAYRITTRPATFIYSTEDGGKSWQEICNTNIAFRKIQFIDDKVWWAMSHRKTIYVTKDSGASWGKIQAEKVDLSDIYFLDEKDGWLIGDAILHFKDGKIEKLSETANILLCIFFLNDRIGWIGGKHILQTKDGGNSWKFINQSNIDSSVFWNLYFLSEKIGWGIYMFPGAVLKTTDGGKTWQDFTSEELDSFSFPNFYFVTELEFWVPAGHNTLHTKDGGMTWQIIEGTSNDIWFLDVEHGYMVRDGKIYYTNDNGNTWNLYYEKEGTKILKLYFISSNIGWGMSYSFETGTGLIYTDSGGRNWQKIKATGISNEVTVVDLLFIDEYEGWIIGVSLNEQDITEIFHTIDGGKTWQETYTIPHLPAGDNILCYDGKSSIYLTTNDRIVRYTDETYSERAKVLKPWSISPNGKVLTFWGKVKKDQLYQNYPNPFNPETWIPYRLANDSEAVIEIYDLGGHLVRKLSLGTKKPGLYITNWDGTNSYGEKVSSGTYFYTIRAGDFSDTKRMVLEK